MYLAHEEWRVCRECLEFKWHHMLIHASSGAYTSLCPHCDYAYMSPAAPKYFTETSSVYRALWLLMQE